MKQLSYRASRGTSIKSVGWLAIALCSVLSAAEPVVDGKGPEAAASKAPPIFTLSALLNKAERIVVADVGPVKDGLVTLIVHETLKAPENNAKYVDPERLKRAAELLADDTRQLPTLPPLPPLPPARKAPATLAVKAGELRLPPEGTQLLFFLWEHAAAEALPSPVKTAPAGDAAPFRIHHPQCVYDVELLPRVKAALARPRAIDDGRYLRDWDRQMAERAGQRAIDEALLKAPGGAVSLGLRVRAARAIPALRADNSFSVTAVIENTRERPQSIYDGPAGGYGVRLRAKNSEPGSGAIIRVSTRDAIADTAVLNIVDGTDFTVVSADNSISKDLFFDAQTYTELKGLRGEYLLSVFFATQHDGKGLDSVTQPVFTGTLLSEEIPIRFGPGALLKK